MTTLLLLRHSREENVDFPKKPHFSNDNLQNFLLVHNVVYLSFQLNYSNLVKNFLNLDQNKPLQKN